MVPMWGDGGVNYCGNHFTVYTCMKSSHGIMWTYTMFYFSYISIKLGGGEEPERRKRVKKKRKNKRMCCNEGASKSR